MKVREKWKRTTSCRVVSDFPFVRRSKLFRLQLILSDPSFSYNFSFLSIPPFADKRTCVWSMGQVKRSQTKNDDFTSLT